MKSLNSFTVMKWNCLFALFATLVVARATIPEPDNILYGNITLDGTLVTATRTDVVIEARRATNGPPVVSYRMGSEPALGNFYSLRLAVESVNPVANTNASEISDSLFIVVSDGSGLRAQAIYTIPDRGVAQRVDFGVAAVDSDGDGLPDVWELQHYANLSQSPGSPGANGLTALQNFIAGTDPNDPNSAFQLRIARTNALKQVSFVALKAEGPGYDGMTRLYTLESKPTFGAGPWSGVPSYVNIAGNNQTVDYVTSSAGMAFFRGKVSLQGFTVPGVDSDHDGLPDAWETLYFGNLSQDASSLSPNGQTALQNFIAGTNPNESTNLFRLNLDQNGSQTTVSFQALPAQGVGYEGKNRYYSLQTSTNLTSWSGVAGFTNLLGNDQPVIYDFFDAASRAYFRGQVWLQNQ